MILEKDLKEFGKQIMIATLEKVELAMRRAHPTGGDKFSSQLALMIAELRKEIQDAT